jgi:aminoglycoside 6'-N-acetyltransferase/ribosomal-protein-alanine N-acetyltransferase
VNVRIGPATADDLAERASWRYEPPYDFYDDDGRPVKNPERFVSVRDDAGELIGFYYFERRGDSVYYGLGLRPDQTGRGLGPEFVQTGIDAARRRFGRRRLVLDVAEFNVRAMTVYERAGFRVTGRKTRYFEGWGDVPFLDMELDA